MRQVLRLGRVLSFDEATGLGSVALDEGPVLDLHCTAIADGSRTIEAGTAVAVRIVPGRRGRWEADDVVRAADGQSSPASAPD